MMVLPYADGDRQRLTDSVARECNARQRDRYRAALLAMDEAEGDEIAERIAHPGKRIRWFMQDEARIGQQGTLTRVWARTGSRPTAVPRRCASRTTSPCCTCPPTRRS